MTGEESFYWGIASLDHAFEVKLGELLGCLARRAAPDFSVARYSFSGRATLTVSKFLPG
jgi:hypothetical protein